jgi:dephospho-CoA kinase
MTYRRTTNLREIAPSGKTPERMVVGLTGNPGAGKSTVARMMESLGAQVVDADVLGHQLLEPNSPVYDRLIQEFGSSVLRPEGGFDRSELGRIVFQNSQRLHRLNEIVHPALIQQIRDRIQRFRSSDERGPLVVDAALLFEWQIRSLFDAIVVVAASEEIRKRRFLALRQLSTEEFVRRNSAQFSEFDKERQADAVFYNEGDLADLRLQVEQFIKN